MQTLNNRDPEPRKKYMNADVTWSAAKKMERRFAHAAKIPPNACPNIKNDTPHF